MSDQPTMVEFALPTSMFGGGMVAVQCKDITALRARVAELDRISMSLAADLLRVVGEDESRQADRIRERIVQWRKQWDATAALAGKQPQEGE